MRHTNHPRDHLPALDRIEAALEASCGILVTLESLSLDPHPPASMQDHVARAVRFFRDAIEELRQAQNNAANEHALGFVMNRSMRPANGAAPESG
jgi:hypothetical protein